MANGTSKKKSKIRLRRTDSLRLTTAHASGDGAGRLPCCRLCGGDVNLRCFSDSFMWEGVEEKYDQLLLDCFGIRLQRVDCMICECCVRQLRNTQRFRLLVYAAFARTPSDYSTQRCRKEVGEGIIPHRINDQRKISKIDLYKKSTKQTIDNFHKKRSRREVGEGNIPHRINNQSKYSKIELHKKSTRTTIDNSRKKRCRREVGEGNIPHRKNNQNKISKIELYKKSTRTTIDNSRKKSQCIERKSIFNSNTQVRRMNVACTMCKQKFPMIVPFEGEKKFVCSRCKKNSQPRNSISRKSNIMVAANMMKDHRELHEKADWKSRSRLFSLPKKSSQIVRNERLVRPKYYCSQCGKKYVVAEHLAHHISTVHENTLDCLCAVCGKDLKTRDLLDRHMRMHTGQQIYHCDVCMRIFKTKEAFQTHYLTHGK